MENVESEYPSKVGCILLGCQFLEFVPQPDTDFYQTFVHQMGQNDIIVSAFQGYVVLCDAACRKCHRHPGIVIVEQEAQALHNLTSSLLREYHRMRRK